MDTHPLFGKKILVLENEVLIMLDIAESMVPLGCQVLKAYNVNSALEILEHDKPDAALIDYGEIEDAGMPCFGTSLDTLSIPYAFVTGVRKPDMDDEYRRGARVLAKPFTRQALVELVQALLK